LVLKKYGIFSPRQQLAKIADSWRKSSTVGENRRQLAKIVDSWRKSSTVGENRRQLAKITNNTKADIVEIFILDH
jgi:hypothetical protein